MEKSVEGIYRNGRVELLEPLGGAEGSRVIVTLIHPPKSVDLGDGASTKLRQQICGAG